jgi:GntR family transcriptional regulator
LAADLGVNLNTVAVAYRQLQSEGLITVRHGSGAVVSSRTTTEQNDSELRKPLRAALTQLVLSGLSMARIMRMVADELSFLTKRAKE